MIIPANINHRSWSRWRSAWLRLCKINANIGNLGDVRTSTKNCEKLRTAVKYGADTVMDLSTGGDIPMIRKRSLRHSPVPIGTVPIYEALSRVRRVEDLNIERDARSDRRAGRAGRGLHDDPRGRAGAVHSADDEADHRDREPRRRDSGRVDGEEPQAEFPVRVLRRHLQDLPEVRRELLAGRRAAAGLRWRTRATRRSLRS